LPLGVADESVAVTKKGLRRRSTVLTGSPRGGNGDDGGLAGVREPRRPKPTPPGVRQTREA
jgi:hypothetical protein